MPTNSMINKLFYIIYHQNHIGIQMRVLVCDSTAYTDILLGHDAMLTLGM